MISLNTFWLFIQAIYIFQLDWEKHESDIFRRNIPILYMDSLITLYIFRNTTNIYIYRLDWIILSILIFDDATIRQTENKFKLFLLNILYHALN